MARAVALALRGSRLQVEQCRVASIHRKGHGIVHVRDAPAATLVAEARGCSKPKVNVLAGLLRARHVLQAERVGDVSAAGHLEAVRFGNDWSLPSGEPLLERSRIVSSLGLHAEWRREIERHFVIGEECNHGRGVLVADCLSKIGEHASHLVLGLGHVRPPLPLGFFMWVQSVGATRVPRAEGNRPIRTNGAVVSVGGPSVGRSAEGSTAYEQPALPVTVSFSLEAVATLLPGNTALPGNCFGRATWEERGGRTADSKVLRPGGRRPPGAAWRRAKDR